MNRSAAFIVALALLALTITAGLARAGSPAGATASPAATPVAIDVDLPSSSTGVPGGTLAVRIFAPATPGDARYADGAPVIISAPGGSTAGSLRPTLEQAADTIRIVFLFPGGTDPLTGRTSDGSYDYRGPHSIAALRDVILYAAGELTDASGNTIDDVLPVPVLHDNIGLFGGSNGGNIVVAVAAEHGAELAGRLRYILQWESPVSSQIATVDWNGALLDCPDGRRVSLGVVNPRYQNYGPLVLDVDHSQLAHDAGDPRHPVFFDGDGDGRYSTAIDPSNGCRTPDLDLNGTLELDEDFPLSTYSDGVTKFYSRPVTQALADQSVFGASWPADIATPAQASAFWNLREAVRLYPAALTNIPDLEGMILGSVIDHVQVASDKPHLRQAFDGWRGVGSWVKINPARKYVVDVDPSLGSRTDLPDNAANAAPADWTDAGSYAYPEGLDEVYLAAAVHEMADRAHAASVTPTATRTSTPTSTSTQTPTRTPTVTATPTTPTSAECVSDANSNGRLDVVDIMATAADESCQVYLPVAVARWRASWPTSTPTTTSTPTSTATATPTATPTSTATSTATVTHPEIPDATYESHGDVTFITIPHADCTNVTSSPIVVGDYLLLPMHDKGFGCQPRGPYANTLLGYHFGDGKIHLLAERGSAEGTLLYQPEEDLVYWPTTFGGAVRLLEPDTFEVIANVEIGTTVDSSGAYLDGLFYFGTVNPPEANCQDPVNKACGAIFAIDNQGQVVYRLDVDDGFRSWIGAGITTDGEYLYVGGSPQNLGDSESEYLYGCSTVKLDKSLNILASADPGVQGCYDSGAIRNNDEDAVGGEVVLGPDSAWVQYVSQNDSEEKVALIRYDRNLVEQCRVELDYHKEIMPAGYYQAPTVDKDGNAYVTYTFAGGAQSKKGVLLKVTPQCEVSQLAEVVDSEALSTPTLADDQYVLFATNGKLSIYTLDGVLVREYGLGSDAKVIPGPVLHDGVIYVWSEDATLTIIENTGFQGYGNAYWPRYRHDNYGSGRFSEPTATPGSSPTPVADPVPPLHLFYAIHTHVQGDWYPYTDQGMTNLDPVVANNMIAAIAGIAGVLDDHGTKGSWEVVYGTSRGLCTYQGESHIFQQLLDSGHEVGVHAHRTEHTDDAFGNLQDFCGITSDLTSGFMIEASNAGPTGAQEAASQAVEAGVALGMRVGTENLSPAGRRNPFGELCDNQIGVGNDMWEETGNLMFPWRPDYANRNICADNPEGGMVFVDHVGPDWMSLPGTGMADVLTDANFDQLRQQFDAALAYMEENRPGRVTAWGFVSHINEYAVGDRGENPPDVTALAALDRFLDYVDSKVAEGRVVYATAGEIASLAFPTSDPGTPSVEQLPIHLVYANHVEVESVIDYRPPLMDGATYTATPDRHAYTSGQLEWEMAQAEAVGARISFHMSGAYAERAVAAGDQARWTEHLSDGHSVGVHFHSFLHGSGPFQWTYSPSPAEEQIVQAWQDNHDLVAALVGADTLWVGESHYGCQTCWEELGYRLRSTEQMAQLPAGQHIVWLVERDASGVITYPHFPQIGQASWHGPAERQIYFDLRLPQLKKEFLMLYLEWLERERLGLAPQVWAWGWVNHGGGNTQRYAADIQAMLTWLSDNFVGRTSPRGNVIAEFVSDHQLSEIYEAHEQGGGQPLPSPRNNVNDQFPHMAYALQDAGVTADLSGALGLPGVRLFELERVRPENPLQRVYLLFRDADGNDVVDISGVLAARGVDPASLTLIDVVDGSIRQVDGSSLLLGPTPLVLEGE